MKRLIAVLTVAMFVVLPAQAGATVFSNSASVAINEASSSGCFVGMASPYPSEISVAGLAGSVTDVDVTLDGFTHGSPDDVGVLLVGPEGQKAVLMADVGGSSSADVDLSFDDAAAGSLPDDGQIASGTYRPTRGTGGLCTAPASFPGLAPAGPYGTTLSGFNGGDPNGTWSLYVIDDTALFAAGSIAGGWSLDITTVAPTCEPTGGDVKCTFAYSGTAQTWTVPAGVTEATFDLYGARGANFVLGGLGGRATATIAVTAGASIQVNVGGEGKEDAGGFNGGGGGPVGGGGASDIRIGGTALTDPPRVLVAGGGGASGSCGNGIDLFSAGGAGGGEEGGDATGPNCDVPGGPSPGRGGTQDGGGSATAPATPGDFGLGGDADPAAVDGGGGGGWYGGGGGFAGGGGGGGSGHGPPGTVFETGVRSGNGLVTVTYKQPDLDGDGFGDVSEDNCPAVSNPGQADLDGDGQGDACDADGDGDGVADVGDNCPTVANPDQVNTDQGATGDACDSDDDNDGVADTGDNCRVVVNAGQQDMDADGQGDACDGDDDGDGAADAGDNCPAVANADQRDTDGDAAGDACDADDDNDRLSDLAERRLGTSSADLDSDDDGLADGREDRNHDGRKGRRETSAKKFDTDRDGLGDGLERGLKRGVKDPPGPVKGTGRRFKRDRDPRSKTNPLRRDSDRGGVPDGREDKNHNGRVDKGETNPRKPGNG